MALCLELGDWSFRSSAMIHSNAPRIQAELDKADRGQIVFSMRKRRPRRRRRQSDSGRRTVCKQFSSAERRNCDHHFRQSSLHALNPPVQSSTHLMTVSLSWVGIISYLCCVEALAVCMQDNRLSKTQKKQEMIFIQLVHSSLWLGPVLPDL